MGPRHKDGSPLTVGGAPANSADCCCCCLDSSDGWTGSGGDSGSVGDDEFNCRWDDSVSPDTWSIASSQISITVTDDSSNNLDNNIPDHSGTFSFSGSMDSSDFPEGSGTDFSQVVGFVGFTSGRIAWGFYNLDANFGNPENQGLFILRTGQSDVYVDTTSFTSRSWTLVRSGSTVTLNFNSTNYTYTNSGDVTRFLYQGIDSGGLPDYTVNFGAVVLQDGSSNEIGLCS